MWISANEMQRVYGTCGGDKLQPHQSKNSQESLPNLINGVVDVVAA